MSGNRFGIIGLGLMGREFASAVARWSHLTVDAPRPVITGICSPHERSHEWFRAAIPTLEVDTTDYRERPRPLEAHQLETPRRDQR